MVPTVEGASAEDSPLVCQLVGRDEDVRAERGDAVTIISGLSGKEGG